MPARSPCVVTTFKALDFSTMVRGGRPVEPIEVTFTSPPKTPVFTGDTLSIRRLPAAPGTVISLTGTILAPGGTCMAERIWICPPPKLTVLTGAAAVMSADTFISVVDVGVVPDVMEVIVSTSRFVNKVVFETDVLVSSLSPSFLLRLSLNV